MLLLALAGLGLPASATAEAVDEPSVVGGTVTDDAGAPLAGVTLHLQNEDISADCARYGCAGVPGQWTVVTDADGGWTTSTAGFATTIWISEPGFESAFVRDAVAGVVDFRLAPGQPGFDPVTITGHVTDLDGAPVVGAGIVRTPGWRWFELLAETDRRGRYVVRFDPMAWLVEAPDVIAYVPDPDADPDGPSYLLRRVGGAARPLYFEPGATYVEDFQVPPELLPIPDVPDPVTEPAAPTLRAARALGPHRALVRFAAAVSGDEATLYEARCYHRGARQRVARDTHSPIRLAGLRPGRSYRCRVRAANEAGWGSWSARSDLFRTPRRGR